MPQIAQISLIKIKMSGVPWGSPFFHISVCSVCSVGSNPYGNSWSFVTFVGKKLVIGGYEGSALVIGKFEELSLVNSQRSMVIYGKEKISGNLCNLWTFFIIVRIPPGLFG